MLALDYRQNFVANGNPFGLSRPPAWWLEQMWHFDNQLVLFPSQEQPLFRLTRRSRRAPRMGATKLPHPLEAARPKPDTQLFMQYGVVPVCSSVQR